MKYILALIALINVVASIKIGKLTGALAKIESAAESLAKSNTTSNETLKKIVDQAEQLGKLVQSAQESGAKYTDDEVKAIVGLYDGLYGMWYPYYHHPALYPGPHDYYYPYNPWTPAYVSSIDALRSRVTTEAVLDYYRGLSGYEANRIYGKILEGQAAILNAHAGVILSTA